MVGCTRMPANHGKFDGKDLIVDMILGKNYLNQIITSIDLGVLKFNGSLRYISHRTIQCWE